MSNIKIIYKRLTKSFKFKRLKKKNIKKDLRFYEKSTKEKNDYFKKKTIKLFFNLKLD